MCIHIGQASAAERVPSGFDFSTLGKDGITIRKVDNDLILAGDRPRGTLYAVYTFLEDNVGCRWWTPHANYIPKKPTLKVRVNDVTYVPPFMCRETFYKNVMSQNPEFAVRLKLNGHFQPIPSERVPSASLMPHPNFRVLAPNIRLFEKSNVVGLFEQGDGYNPDVNFAAMKTWLLAHLMWNPQLNERNLMDEFLTGYYGAAGKYMRQYIDLICDSAEKTGRRLCWQNKNHDFLTPEVIEKANALFEAAERSVQHDDELTRRVTLQRAAVYLAMVVTSADEDIAPAKGLAEACEKFLAISDPSSNNYRQEGIVMSPEHRQYLKNVSQGIRRPATKW